ncbi:zinc transporter ZIP10 isoform X1 [Monodelphis domestica]|uniref:Solute carrier family 39 member 10 n=2 Tax=Monodelphis domestica TaxID=13616 RepID=F7ALF5_MONDO|nr:zinc transporter ZIP10 isoform X1 [Monodelphis domestica]
MKPSTSLRRSEMKVHMHTKFCLICLLTFIFHQCNHCHEEGHDHHNHNHNDYQISEAPYLHGGITESEASKFSVPDAENEKKYYIEKLFARYGENGRLSFFGLEKLLTSLGLGEIKVVEINHEDIGHDHVSHLDILAVQEGKHFHSHNHQHSHNHLNSENQTGTSGMSKRNHKCDPEKDTAEVPVKFENKHSHDHNRHPHHHHHLHPHLDHNTTHHSHNDSMTHSEHGEPSHAPSSETNTTQEQAEVKLRKPKKKKKGKKVTTPDSAPNHNQGEQHEHNRVHKYDHVHLPEHNGHHGHQDPDPHNEEHWHPRKREAPHKQNDVKKNAVSSAHSHKDHSHNEECLNVTQLLRYYGHWGNTPISPDLFTYLCPALLYQIDSRLCIEHFDELLFEDMNKDKNIISADKANIGASAWICGIISITVISLLSLLGVILVPIINQGCFKFLLTFLVALAVGTMSGDALLHLLPHSQGGHDHSHRHGHGHGHGHGHSHGHETKHPEFLEEYDAVLKGLVALGGIYLLFIIEHCIRMFKHYKQQRGKQKWFMKQKAEESAIGRKLSDHKLNNTPDADWLQLKPLAGTDDSVVSEDRLNETELTELEGQPESPPKHYLCIEEEKIMDHSHGDGVIAVHEHDLHCAAHNNHEESKTVLRKHNHQWHHKHSHHSHGPCHSGSDLKETGIANIAWMVIMGDGIHNFSDGLAIGAAFSAGLTGGISTSIAVFCHELPHELGDFAVLLKAGMTVKQAIVYNLLSAMMAYIGMLIGTAVGQYANNITLWIFAITAGMFLYVALVDMLPEMLHGDGDNEEHGYCPVGQFILQNFGLLFGFAIMLVIALYEDKIVFDIQF